MVLSILSVSLETLQVSVDGQPGRFVTVVTLEKWINSINAILFSISQTQIVNGTQLFSISVFQRPSYTDDMYR